MLSWSKSLINFYLRHNFILSKKIEVINKNYESKNHEFLKNEAFIKLLKNTYKNNRFYSKLYNQHGVNIKSINSIEDAKKLPIITKESVKKYSGLIKQSKGLFVRKGYTSGTTGSPLIVYRDYESILNEHAYIWWYRINSGLNPKDRKISIRGDLNRETLYYLDKTSNTLFISSFALNDSNIKKMIPVIRGFNPKAALGYPSSLYTFAVWLEENNEELNIPLSFTSSESLLAFQERIINKTFNTKLYDWYGNAERTIALYRENAKYFEPLLYSINEYENNRVITTSLTNNYFPLIRYEVNDVIGNTSNYDFGKKSIIIESIDGRIEDFVLLPDGSKIGRLDVVFKEVNNIKMAQIIQREIYSLDVKIVINEKFTIKKDQLLLRNNFISKLGEEIKLNFLYVNEEDISFTKSGKFKLVISEI